MNSIIKWFLLVSLAPTNAIVFICLEDSLAGCSNPEFCEASILAQSFPSPPGLAIQQRKKFSFSRLFIFLMMGSYTEYISNIDLDFKAIPRESVTLLHPELPCGITQWEEPGVLSQTGSSSVYLSAALLRKPQALWALFLVQEVSLQVCHLKCLLLEVAECLIEET